MAARHALFRGLIVFAFIVLLSAGDSLLKKDNYAQKTKERAKLALNQPGPELRNAPISTPTTKKHEQLRSGTNNIGAQALLKIYLLPFMFACTFHRYSEAHPQ